MWYSLSTWYSLVAVIETLCIEMSVVDETEPAMEAGVARTGVIVTAVTMVRAGAPCAPGSAAA